MNEKIESLKGKLIVPCQALPHEPLYSAFIVGWMASAAREDGVYSIRANTKEDVAEIQAQVDLSVTGIMKRDYGDSKVYIASTMKKISGLVEVKPEIIALDAAGNLGSGGRTLDEFYRGIRESYPGQLLVVDCSIVEETLRADQLGFDFIGTTLIGYTDQSKNLKIESNDFEIIHRIVATVKHRVIVGRNINTPEKAGRIIELGVFSVVVGSIITKPQLITKSFAQTLD